MTVKTSRAEPTAFTLDKVQYTFENPVSWVLAAARQLGMAVRRDAALLWIADEALVELLASAKRGVVLTRNSHRDGIRTFLDERHLGHVTVRSAKLEQTSKAAILKELLDAQDARFANRPIPGTHGVRAVYADDDVHELCEEGVAALSRAGRVVRVLFAPGGVG